MRCKRCEDRSKNIIVTHGFVVTKCKKCGENIENPSSDVNIICSRCSLNYDICAKCEEPLCEDPIVIPDNNDLGLSDNVFKINIPFNEEDFKKGNGEGIFGCVSDNTLEKIKEAIKLNEQINFTVRILNRPVTIINKENGESPKFGEYMLCTLNEPFRPVVNYEEMIKKYKPIPKEERDEIISKIYRRRHLDTMIGDLGITNEQLIRLLERLNKVDNLDLMNLNEEDFYNYVYGLTENLDVSELDIIEERVKNNNEFLNTRICDAVDGAKNTQTYLEFIRESEDTFGMNHKKFEAYTIKEIKDYINFLDELWNK